MAYGALFRCVCLTLLTIMKVLCFGCLSMKTISPKNESCKQKSGEIRRFLRFMEESGLTVPDIAEATGVSARTINNCIYSDLPLGMQLLREIHLKLGVSMDWLVSGVGHMMVGGHVAESKSHYALGNPRATRLAAFIDDWMQSRTEDEQVWLEVQIKRAVPEYVDFLHKAGIYER